MAEADLLLGFPCNRHTQLASLKSSHSSGRLGSLLALLPSNAMEAFDVDLSFSNDFDFFCHPGLAGNWSGGGGGGADDATEEHLAQVGTSGPTSQVPTQDQKVEERSRDSAVTDDDDEQEDLLPLELRARRKQLFFRKRIEEETEKRDLCHTVTDRSHVVVTCESTETAQRNPGSNRSRQTPSAQFATASSFVPSSSLPLASSSSSSVVTPFPTRRRRKRVINAEQRLAANVRERKRMTFMNAAFDSLRQRMPPTTFERRGSRIEILKSAVSYIRFLSEILETLRHQNN